MAISVISAAELFSLEDEEKIIDIFYKVLHDESNNEKTPNFIYMNGEMRDFLSDRVKWSHCDIDKLGNVRYILSVPVYLNFDIKDVYISFNCLGFNKNDDGTIFAYQIPSSDKTEIVNCRIVPDEEMKFYLGADYEDYPKNFAKERKQCVYDYKRVLKTGFTSCSYEKIETFLNNKKHRVSEDRIRKRKHFLEMSPNRQLNIVEKSKFDHCMDSHLTEGEARVMASQVRSANERFLEGINKEDSKGD